MIIALLILISLILLFGAAAVKGWIQNAVVVIIGFAAICTALIWLGSFFGEDGLTYVMLAITATMFGLVLLALILSQLEREKTEAKARDENRKAERKAIKQKPKIERLWHYFAPEIERFDSDARAKAQSFYDTNNVEALRQFCQKQIEKTDN